LSQINSLYVPALYSNIPPGLAGVMNLSSGWLYKTVSWSWTTELTVELWMRMSSRQGLAMVFDTRYFNTNGQPASAGFYYLEADGRMGLGTTPTAQTIGTSAISLNTWTHLAWVLHDGIWNTYMDGILVGSLSNTTLNIGSSATNLNICGDPTNMVVSSIYKLKCSIFQPMVTAKAKYTTNFVPANDLSVGASSNPVLFFMNPGVNGGFQDLATGSSMTMGGPAVTPDVRYLTY
jgi:hypothetical protein